MGLLGGVLEQQVELLSEILDYPVDIVEYPNGYMTIVVSRMTKCVNSLFVFCAIWRNRGSKWTDVWSYCNQLRMVR